MTILRVPPTASNVAAWIRDAARAIGQLIGEFANYLPLTGGTLTGDLIVPDEVYGVGWNGSLEVPTKNALYDKIEAISAGGVSDGDKGDITVSGTGATWTIDNGVVTLAKQANMATASVVYRKTAGAGAPEVQTLATLKTDLGLAGTNSGDQTSIVGITGTKAQFDTACSDGNFLYVGDVTQYTDEQAQDAIGAMVDGSLTYVDATPLLQRAALTGDITASAGSNTTTLATVNSNVGTFGSASAIPIVTANAKGLVTAVSTATPARVLITETTTSGSATNVSFTSIPGTYRDLEVRVRGRGTKVATLVDIRMRFNADTGANYDHNDHQLNNTTTAGFTSVAATSALLGNLAAASATANYADFLVASIADYRGTTFQKAGHFKGSIRHSTTAASTFVEHGCFWWRSTAAITQIDVFPSGNAFVDGTVVSLYGIM